MRAVVILLLLVVAPASAAAQLSLATSGVAVGESFAGYEGLGLAPFPGSGQLDSDTWSVRGASDGDSAWGLTYDWGDFARGTSSGGIFGGGAYAFAAAGPADAALGVQPTEEDFTPGAAVLRMRNDTGGTLTRLDVSFEAWSRNDADRGVSFVLEHSTDDFSWTPTSASATTLGLADFSPTWTSIPFTTSITGLSVPPGAYVYLRWAVADAGGSGARDEVALDDVRVTPFTTSTEVDAGTPDAGSDAGTLRDAGLARDAGTARDGGRPSDAGGGMVESDADLPRADSGFGFVRMGGRRGGCSAASGSAAGDALPLLVIALLVLARTRRVR